MVAAVAVLVPWEKEVGEAEEEKEVLSAMVAASLGNEGDMERVGGKYHASVNWEWVKEAAGCLSTLVAGCSPHQGYEGAGSYRVHFL